MELQSSFSAKYIEAGVDEAGRGCLAGPVVAAAVILPKKYQNTALRDSKKLNAKAREALRQVIEKDALAWAVGTASPEEIDRINILQASFLAMHRALEGLSLVPELVLVDGNRFVPYRFIPYECIVKGDDKFLAIAAASIIAKTERDAQMRDLAEEYPAYGWAQNAGYPTAKHRAAIAQFGTTPWHRKSFKLLPD